MDSQEKVKVLNVEICGQVEKQISATYSDFDSGLLGEPFEVSEGSAQYTGTAVSIEALLNTARPQADCTHVMFYAHDEFRATFPLAELKDAFLIFKQNGAPLVKGSPVRLVVPNGWSECLNVKSVIKIEVVKDINGEPKSTFGYRNFVQLTEL